MENPQYEQLQLFYTQEEVDAKVSEATLEGVRAVARAYTNTAEDLRARAISWFKSEVRSGTMAKDDALGIFNGLADALAWETIDNISSIYSVTVSVDDKVIGTFEGVEADDEEDAVSTVLEEVEADMRITITYNGETLSESYDAWQLDLDAEAVEE